MKNMTMWMLLPTSTLAGNRLDLLILKLQKLLCNRPDNHHPCRAPITISPFPCHSPLNPLLPSNFCHCSLQPLQPLSIYVLLWCHYINSFWNLFLNSNNTAVATLDSVCPNVCGPARLCSLSTWLTASLLKWQPGVQPEILLTCPFTNFSAFLSVTPAETAVVSWLPLIIG